LTAYYSTTLGCASLDAVRIQAYKRRYGMDGQLFLNGNNGSRPAYSVSSNPWTANASYVATTGIRAARPGQCQQSAGKPPFSVWPRMPWCPSVMCHFLPLPVSRWLLGGHSRAVIQSTSFSTIHSFLDLLLRIPVQNSHRAGMGCTPKPEKSAHTAGWIEQFFMLIR